MPQHIKTGDFIVWRPQGIDGYIELKVHRVVDPLEEIWAKATHVVLPEDEIFVRVGDGIAFKLVELTPSADFGEQWNAICPY